MSVSSISSNQQIQAQQAYRPPPRADFDQDAGTTPTGTGAAQGSGGTNPFSKLVTDLQSALVSLQGSGGASATGTTTASTTSASTTDPLTTLQNDLQSIISQFQSGGTSGATSAATGAPGAGGTPGAGAAHGHHHHHKDNDSQTASSSTTATSTATATAPAAAPTSGIVDSILQAFKSAMQGNPASTTAGASSALSVSA